MKKRSDKRKKKVISREKILGLGERSMRKTYFPELMERLKDLERFQKLIDRSTDAIFLLSVPSGHIVDLNETACRFLASQRETLLKRSLEEYVPSSLWTILQELFESSHTKDKETVFAELHPVSGDKIPVEMSIHLDAFEDDLYAITVARDITKRRQAEEERMMLEEQLRQTEKMDAVGQLAGGIAHDFNNLLMGVLGYANVLRLDLEPGTPAYASADTIRKAALRMSELTQRLLGFARKGKFQMVPLDIHSIAREVMVLLKRSLGKDIRIDLELHAEKAFVKGDPGQIRQIFMNLTLNAKDAMPEGGRICFCTDTIDLTEEFCKTHPETIPGRYLLITISDTGCGMPKEVKDRIFEPFFTTKRLGEAAGMGLATVYGIVKNHGGAIEVFSEEGQGTAVKVYLPLSEEKAPVRRKVKAPRVKKGNGCILLVDDEALVLDVASDMLRKMGYEVVKAKGAQDAVDYYKEHGKDVDLVIIDMLMPKMDGRACFQALKEIDGEVKAVLSSGYGPDDETHELLNQGMLGFIQKPYQIGSVRKELDQILGKGNET